MGQPYEIVPYHISTLKRILSSKSGALPSVVEAKLHTLYFKHYFDHLKAATILVENDYVDRDFMEDYAGYYARCFGKYDSSCTRLHFFSRSFTARQFSFTLTGRGQTLSETDLKKSYLGFVVVKKLPKTFIGRTCLRTYGSDNDRRWYPALRRYQVGLYGLELSVDETLGFQEQDKGVAACATSALWAVFQGTGKLFQHAIPSPVEITRMATQIPDLDVPGTFPSRGLTGRQEISAIRQLGLEAEHTAAQNEFNLAGSVYAYLRAGIPLLLRVSLYDISHKPHAKNMGGHAIAVTGFSLGRDKLLTFGPQKFRLRSTLINKLYGHDDQVGPFARMELDGLKVSEKINRQTVAWNSLSTSWRGDDGKLGSVRAVPRFLLVPLYPKIRIRFEFIRHIIMKFDEFARQLIQMQKLKLPSTFEWDIYLTTVNKLKADLRTDSWLSYSSRKLALLQNMPRFIWRARAVFEDRPYLEILFDATDIEQGKFCVCALEYDKSLFTNLRGVSRAFAPVDSFQFQPYWRILEWFASKS
jgi:hypothetical protein